MRHVCCDGNVLQIQKEHSEQIEQQMRERCTAKSAQTNSRRKKPTSAELPKVLTYNVSDV